MSLDQLMVLPLELYVFFMALDQILVLPPDLYLVYMSVNYPIISL